MSSVPHSVTIRVSARLHFGFLDLNGGLGRRFGSIGVALGSPQTRIIVARAPETRVSGPDSARARRYVGRLHEWLGLEGGCRVHVAEAIPVHAGLGSGTQLALALGAGVRLLHGLPCDPRGDARQLGRGKRSGIGIALFESGGVVVDGGHGRSSDTVPVICRMPFPKQWRIVLVLDRARTGVHGEDEIAAFARLPPFAAGAAAHICRLVLMQALPALAEADLISFGAAIKEMQSVLGAHFSPVQGGAPFASPDVAAALALLEQEGAVGMGQSSWGPTGFAFAASPGEADRLVRLAQGYARGHGLDIRVCEGLNRGAEIAANAAAAMPGA